MLPKMQANTTLLRSFAEDLQINMPAGGEQRASHNIIVKGHRRAQSQLQESYQRPLSRSNEQRTAHTMTKVPPQRSAVCASAMDDFRRQEVVKRCKQFLISCQSFDEAAQKIRSCVAQQRSPAAHSQQQQQQQQRHVNHLKASCKANAPKLYAGREQKLERLQELQQRSNCAQQSVMIGTLNQININLPSPLAHNKGENTTKVTQQTDGKCLNKKHLSGNKLASDSRRRLQYLQNQKNGARGKQEQCPEIYVQKVPFILQRGTTSQSQKRRLEQKENHSKEEESIERAQSANTAQEDPEHDSQNASQTKTQNKKHSMSICSIDSSVFEQQVPHYTRLNLLPPTADCESNRKLHSTADSRSRRRTERLKNSKRFGPYTSHCKDSADRSEEKTRAASSDMSLNYKFMARCHTSTAAAAAAGGKSHLEQGTDTGVPNKDLQCKLQQMKQNGNQVKQRESASLWRRYLHNVRIKKQGNLQALAQQFAFAADRRDSQGANDKFDLENDEDQNQGGGVSRLLFRKYANTVSLSANGTSVTSQLLTTNRCESALQRRGSGATVEVSSNAGVPKTSYISYLELKRRKKLIKNQSKLKTSLQQNENNGDGACPDPYSTSAPGVLYYNQLLEKYEHSPRDSSDAIYSVAQEPSLDEFELMRNYYDTKYGSNAFAKAEEDEKIQQQRTKKSIRAHSYATVVHAHQNPCEQDSLRPQPRVCLRDVANTADTGVQQDVAAASSGKAVDFSRFPTQYEINEDNFYQEVLQKIDNTLTNDDKDNDSNRFKQHDIVQNNGNFVPHRGTFYANDIRHSKIEIRPWVSGSEDTHEHSSQHTIQKSTEKEDQEDDDDKISQPTARHNLLASAIERKKNKRKKRASQCFNDENQKENRAIK